LHVAHHPALAGRDSDVLLFSRIFLLGFR
jgi:hypothetical protein